MLLALVANRTFNRNRAPPHTTAVTSGCCCTIISPTTAYASIHFNMTSIFGVIRHCFWSISAFAARVESTSSSRVALGWSSLSIACSGPSPFAPGCLGDEATIRFLGSFVKFSLKYCHIKRESVPYGIIR
jgi:hypothetical protein